jgi:pimeloyl-ACP methyl ester carboxylesterase
VVDWPGVGRSGFAPDFLTMGAEPIVDGVVALLGRIGPAAVIGHSMGGGVSFKVAERAPELVRAVVAVTPTPPHNVMHAEAAAPLTDALRFPPEIVRQMFARSARFPQAAFEDYYRSLVPLSPSILNAAVRGVADDLRIDRPEVVRALPMLLLAVEDDPAVPRERTEAAAAFFGVPQILVGDDWSLPGHGHMLIIEEDNLVIADLVQQWLESDPAARR